MYHNPCAEENSEQAGGNKCQFPRPEDSANHPTSAVWVGDGLVPQSGQAVAFIAFYVRRLSRVYDLALG